MGRFLGMSVALALAATIGAEAHAMCDVIPGTSQEFRGALGTVNRPYALPGDDGQQVILTLTGCAADAPGFVNRGGATLEDDYWVTVVFKPPRGGPPNAVVLTTEANLVGCEALAQGVLPDGRDASCLRPRPGEPELFRIPDERTLRFLFPDTDAEFRFRDDDRTFTGPAAIAVTAVHTPEGDVYPLPVGLATARCADLLDTPGLVACVDELYARDGTCEATSPHIDPVFGHFTALPPANNYQALCSTVQTECLLDERPEVRFTVDAAGHALVPMDWRGVLLRPDGIPLPRLVSGTTSFPAFSKSDKPVQIPSRAYLTAFSTDGQRLPPIFEPLADPASNKVLSLFGSVDSPIGVFRIARRICQDSEGQATNLSCSRDSDCPPGQLCGDSIFDFSDRLDQNVGPILIDSDDYEADAENPVSLEGLVETEEMFAFVELEQIAGMGAEDMQRTPRDLNQDGDMTDPVLVLRDRKTGVRQSLTGLEGRAVTRIRQPPFSFSAVAAEGDLVAFLEPEPLQGVCTEPADCDNNNDGDVFDTILRVYRLNPHCEAEVACEAEDLTAGMKPLAIDATPAINGRSVVVSGGLVFFRLSESANATRRTHLVSRAPGGTCGDGPSRHPRVSADGSLVAFNSRAKNLTADPDPNGTFPDVFVARREAGGAFVTPERVGPDGAAPVSLACVNDQRDVRLALSGDGSVLAFGALRPDGIEISLDILAEETSGPLPVMSCGYGTSPEGVAFNTCDVSHLSHAGRFLTIRREEFVEDDLNLSTSTSIFDSNGEAESLIEPSVSGAPISADGQYVAFQCSLQDQNVCVLDTTSGARSIVSVASDGASANGASTGPAMSRDGRFVAFFGTASNLVAGDTNGRSDVFLHDRDADEDGIFDEDGAISTVRVSVSSAGSQGNDTSGFEGVAISPDGRFVGFASSAENLVASDQGQGPCGAAMDVFIHDRLTGLTERVSVENDGTEACGPSRGFPGGGWISEGARIVAFSSSAENLASCPSEATGDCGEAVSQVFVRATDAPGDSAQGGIEILHVLVPGGDIVPIGAAEDVEVVGRSAAFLSLESEAGLDRNGDGDLDDRSVILWEGDAFPAQAAPLYLEREGVALSLSNDLVAALVPGEAGEPFLQVYDRQTGAWTGPFEPSSNELATAGTRVAFTARQGSAPGSPSMLFLFDQAQDERPRAVGEAVEEFVLGERVLAFRTLEEGRGADLNGDGDTVDSVLQVLDLATNESFNTGQAATPCRLEVCDPKVPYRVAGDTVTFLTRESDHDSGDATLTPGCQPTDLEGECDLDGDGKGGGLVLQTFNVRQALVLSSDSLQAAASASGTESSMKRAHVVLASTSTGICTNTAEPCSEDPDCGDDGACFLPPGGCIENLGIDCTPENPVECSEGEFCEPLSPAIGVCKALRGSCSSNKSCVDICGGPCTCEDGTLDAVRIATPLTDANNGGAAFVSAATVPVGPPASCLQEADCGSGEICGDGGTCRPASRMLVIAGAADSDGDGLVDPFDNCPLRANSDQADGDGDGVGDLCDLTGPDTDFDGWPDPLDNCPFHPNDQRDLGGVGFNSAPDGIGDACQCGDVTGDGFVTSADALVIRRALLVPPNAVMESPELCDVGASEGCSSADALLIQRALLRPSSATIQQTCAPATRPACGVHLDKKLATDAGSTFHDTGAIGWNAYDSTGDGVLDAPAEAVAVRFEITNTGSADLECMLVDEINGVQMDVQIPNGGLVPALSPPVVVVVGDTCRDEIAGVDLATLSCECLDGSGEARTATDSAELLCLMAEVSVVKQCLDDDQNGVDETVDITVTNLGTSSLENCAVLDTLELSESPGVCPGDGSPTQNVAVAPAVFDLAVGAPSQRVSGVFAGIQGSACNTATVSCNVAGTQKQITRSAQASCEVALCEVAIDKKVSGDGGQTFLDTGAVGWSGEPVAFQFVASNTGTVPVTCSLVDEQTDETIPVSLPAGGLMAPGQTLAPIIVDDVCRPELQGPDTARLSCQCGGGLGLVEATDASDLECRVADLDVSKVCQDLDGDGTDETVEITVTNASLPNDLGKVTNFLNCRVTDTIYRQDLACPPSGSGEDVPVPDIAELPGLTQTMVSATIPIPLAASSVCNLASVTCDLEDPTNPGNPVPGKSITATDTAICAGLCAVTIDKRVSGDGGATFLETGAIGWNAYDSTGDGVQDMPPEAVAFEFTAANTGTVPVICSLVDERTGETVPVPLPNAGLIAPGEALGPIVLSDVCRAELEGVDTARLTCACEGGAGNLEVTDQADLDCRTPDLSIVKQCLDTGGDASADAVMVDVFNQGDANLVNCVVIDTIDLNEALPSVCPGNGVDTQAVPLEPNGFALSVGASQSLSGSFGGDLLLPACNTASVTCEIAGTSKTITRATFEECAFSALCAVSIDKKVSGDGGATFLDTGAIGWNAYDSTGDGAEDMPPEAVAFEFTAANTGTVPVICSLVDEHAGETIPVPLPNAGLIAPGQALAPIVLSDVCRAELKGVNTARLTCACEGGLGNREVTDVADLDCRTPDLAISGGSCGVEPGGTILDLTANNIGEADLVTCEVDVSASVPLPPQPFSLAVGQEQGVSQVVSSPGGEVTASVSCLVAGASKDILRRTAINCPMSLCLVGLDKKVSVDGGATFVDGPVAALEGQQLLERFEVSNDGTETVGNCMLTDERHGLLPLQDIYPPGSGETVLPSSFACEPSADEESAADLQCMCELSGALVIDTDSTVIECMPDADADGVSDAADNCPFAPNSEQEDRGGVGFASDADGIGDACQCGDVTGDGFVTSADALALRDSLLLPPRVTLARPDLCDVGGGDGCSSGDVLILRRALLSPPTATIQQVCAPAVDGSPPSP